MRIKGLLCLLTGIALCCVISSCKQKQQVATDTPAIENKSAVADSIILPVTVIVNDDAIEGRQLNANDYPKSITLTLFDTIATPIAAYGVAHCLCLGPEGYTGNAETGEDGSAVIRLFPKGGSEAKPPFVSYQSVPRCVGCMTAAAAPYFKNARADLLSNNGSTIETGSIPKGLVIHKMSATLITYTYKGSNDMQVTGVAYYNVPNGGFYKAEFALGAANKAMTDLLVKQYISMWGLK